MKQPAQQLIAAKLNVFNGTKRLTDGGAIAAADNLLATYSGKLPVNEPSTSTKGMQMVSIAAQLDTFNQDGAGQPGCATHMLVFSSSSCPSTRIPVRLPQAIVSGCALAAPAAASNRAGAIRPADTCRVLMGSVLRIEP